MDVLEVVRTRYHRHLCIQQLASNATPVAFCMSALRSGSSQSKLERFSLSFLLCFVFVHTLVSLAVLLRSRLPRWAKPQDAAVGMGFALALDWAANLFILPLAFVSFMAPEVHLKANCPDAAGYGDCGLLFIHTFGLLRIFRSIAAQIPPRLTFAYELIRCSLSTALGIAAFAMDGTLTVVAVAKVLASGMVAFFVSLVLIQLHHEAIFHDNFLPQWLDLWPTAWRPAREVLLSRLAAVCALARPMSLDYRALSGISALGVALVSMLKPDAEIFTTMHLTAHIVLRIYFTLSGAGLAGVVLTGGSLSLDSVMRRMGMDSDAALLFEVRRAVVDASSEEAALRGAAVAMRRSLFLRASSLVLRVAPATPGGTVLVHVSYADGTEAAADELDCDDIDIESESSLAFVAVQDPCMIADSRDFPSGLATFSDWARASAAGVATVITAPLPAGPAKTGALVVRFGGTSRSALPPANYEAVLMRCCRAIGEGIFARREAATSSAASALASDVFPAHVVAKLLERNRRTSGNTPRHSISGPRPSMSGSRPSMAGQRPSMSLPRPSMSAAPRRSFTGPRPSHSLAGTAPAAPAEATASEAATSNPPSPLREPELPRSSDPETALLRRRLSMRHSQSLTGTVSDEDDEFFSEDHECVSIIFIDCVQFTPLAESQTPAQTMQTLHRLFSRFDALCSELGLYKVETVGDEYMAAAGLLSQRRQHAAAALAFGLRAHGAARACGLRVRVGVHSGPVTSGLVGRVRARFCLFGGACRCAQA